MSDELAIYLGSARKVRDLRDRTLEIVKPGLPLRAGDLTASLKDQLVPALRIPFIQMLLNRGIAQILEGAVSVDEYVIEVDPSLFRKYADDQITAAEVLERVEAQLVAREGNKSSVDVVATVPPELFIGAGAPRFHAIEPSIRRIIANAREFVWIVNPFFDLFGFAFLVPSIGGAADRGVRVRLLTRDVDRQREAYSSAIESIVSEMKDPNAISHLEVRDLFKRSEATGRIQYALHSKVVLADSDTCYIGSANVMEHGMRHNFELGVVLKGDAVRGINDLLERFWIAATPVKLGQRH